MRCDEMVSGMLEPAPKQLQALRSHAIRRLALFQDRAARLGLELYLPRAVRVMGPALRTDRAGFPWSGHDVVVQTSRPS